MGNIKKQIEINGLLWDTKNLEINGKKYFSWQEAMSVAKILGKRLPTREEFQALIDSGWEFDKEKKGMWFADRKLFFPLSGFLHYTSGALSGTDNGYLWSSSPKDDSSSWILYFTDGAAYMLYSTTTHGFPVRCVQDIKSDNSTIQENKMENENNNITIGDYVFVKWIKSMVDSLWIKYDKDSYKTYCVSVISCGKIIYEDEEQISLILNFVEEGENNYAHCSGEIVIPKVCIKDIKKIESPF